MADWDPDSFEPKEPINNAAAMDKWEGEDEEEDVKDNWDDEDEDEEKKAEVTKIEPKVSEKKKLMEKIKEKENRLKKKQQALKNKELENEQEELTAEEQLSEKLRLKKLQEESDLELTNDAFGVGSTTNSVAGIDAMCPSSKEDFTEFEKLLKEKICQFEKSVHYSSFLESLVRELCISLEVDDLKKVSNSLSVLLTEKQKQEKQNKGKKKKKGVVPGGGFKAQMKDDFDYAELDGGYTQDYDDFM